MFELLRSVLLAEETLDHVYCKSYTGMFNNSSNKFDKVFIHYNFTKI